MAQLINVAVIIRPPGLRLSQRRQPPASDMFRRGRAGQALLESCIVIGILCLLLMGLFQLSQLFMAREILHYAAARGARAKIVGFNEFMVFKTVRVGTIANAGRLLAPVLERGAAQPLFLRLGSRFQARSPVLTANGPLAQRAVERARIPLFLGADWHGRLAAILDYADWPDIRYAYVEQASPAMLSFSISQRFPLKFAWHRLFYADDAVPLSGTLTLDNHYPLYLNVE